MANVSQNMGKGEQGKWGKIRLKKILRRPSRLGHHVHAYAYITSFVDWQSFKIALKFCLIFSQNMLNTLD